MSQDQQFGGRTALVLGAAGVIGGAISHDLAARGAQVIGVDLTAAPAATDPWGSGGHRLVLGDATAEATVDEVFASLRTPATLLVNSTICQQETELLHSTAADHHRAFDVMTVAGTRWATALVERLDGRPAAIVTISSVHAVGAAPAFGPYAAAKAAGLALTRTMATEWGPLGVRANAVTPAFVPGPARSRHETPEQRARRSARFPLQRCPTAQDVAAATRFLLSDDAGAITGVSLPVDAGLLSRLP